MSVLPRDLSLAPGTRLGGHTLIRPLGSGAMGSVYLARSDQGAEHALKVIGFPAGERGQRTRQRFLREAEALAKVDRHPGIVSIHASHVDDARGCGYHVLEFVPGSDLAQLLDPSSPLAAPRALELAEQIASALAHVHAAGIVHRDLKPANVLLRADGRTVLTDFGVARDEEAERMTRSGVMVGTPHYMSPEQAGGRWETVGPHSDVFSLGVLLYELLTGSVPFDGQRPLEVLARIATASPEPVSRRRRGLPRELDALLARVLAKDPTQRPTAAETAAALGRLRRGEALNWTRPSAAQAFARRLGRRDPRALAIALGALALPALLLGGWLAWFAPRRAAREFLAEHQGWESRVLTPWALGAGPTPPEPAEVERRLGLLDQARAALGPDAELDARRDHLAAARLVVVPEAAASPAGRTAAQLTADARRRLRAGERAQARRRVTRALGLDPEFLPAQLLLHELDAQDDPLAFLRRVPELAEVAPQLLERTVPAVATRVYADAVALGRDGVPSALEIATQLEALGLELPDLAAIKRAALTDAVSTWCEDLRSAAGAREELAWAADLGRVVNAPPRVALSAEAHAALAATLRELFYVGFTDLPLDERIRPVLLEQALYYEVDPSRGADDSLRGALMDLAVLRRIPRPREQDAALALACLRAEPPLLFSTIAKLTDLAGWEALIARRPRSRGARLGRVMRICEDSGFSSTTAAARSVVAEFERAFDPQRDLLEDVSPLHLATALHWLTRARETLVKTESLPRAEREVQLALLREECPRARAGLAGQLRFYASNLRLEGSAVAALEGAQAGFAVLEAGLPRAHEIAERNMWAQADSPREEQFASLDMTGTPLTEVAEVEGDAVRLLLRLGRLDDALTRARAALTLLEHDLSNSLRDTDRHLGYRALVAAVLRRLGRPQQVLAELEPYAEEGHDEVSFVLEYAQALAASGRRAEARAYLRRGLRLSPSNESLLDLEAELGQD